MCNNLSQIDTIELLSSNPEGSLRIQKSSIVQINRCDFSETLRTDVILLLSFVFIKKTKYASEASEYLICFHDLSPAEYEIPVLLHSSGELLFPKKVQKLF